MAQGTIIIHGIAIIITQDQLHGVLGFIGILTGDGDFLLGLVLVGWVGVSILMVEELGEQQDIEWDIDMDTIMDVTMDIIVVGEMELIAVIWQEMEVIEIGMYIIIENQE